MSSNTLPLLTQQEAGVLLGLGVGTALPHIIKPVMDSMGPTIESKNNVQKQWEKDVAESMLPKRDTQFKVGGEALPEGLTGCVGDSNNFICSSTLELAGNPVDANPKAQCKSITHIDFPGTVCSTTPMLVHDWIALPKYLWAAKESLVQAKIDSTILHVPSPLPLDPEKTADIGSMTCIKAGDAEMFCSSNFHETVPAMHSPEGTCFPIARLHKDLHDPVHGAFCTTNLDKMQPLWRASQVYGKLHFNDSPQYIDPVGDAP